MSEPVEKLALGVALIAIGISTGGAGIMPWYGSLAVGTGVNLAIAGLQQMRMGKPHHTPYRPSFRANVRSTLAPYTVIFGEVRVGGIVAAIDASKTNTDNDTIHMVLLHGLAHAGGYEGVITYYLGAKEVPLANIDASGNVIQGDFTDLVQLLSMEGTGAQDAIQPVYTGIEQLTPNARFSGICYTYARFLKPELDETFREKFPAGIPEVSVIVRGMKCYDPRKDDTEGGLGEHRKDNPLTWEYTNNTALCVGTYLIMARLDGGAAWPSSVINWNYVAAAADVCDELVTIPDGVGGSVQQPRYVCNIALSTADPLESNIKKMLDSMVGRMVCVSGKWCLFAGAYTAPTFHIRDEHLRGPYTVSPRVALEDVYNEVLVTYNDREANYTSNTAAIQTNAAYIAADDGNRVVKELQLDAVTGEYQAQRIGHIHLEMSRMQEASKLPLNLAGLDIAPWSVVTWSSDLYGISERTYRVHKWVWNDEEGAPDVELVREDASVYNMPLVNYTERAPLPAPFPLKLPIPAIPTDFQVQGVADGIEVSYTPPPRHTYVCIEVYRAPDEDGAPGQFAFLKSIADDTWIDVTKDGLKYWYKVRTRNVYGQKSEFTDALSGTGKRSPDAAFFSTVNLLDTKATRKYVSTSSGYLITYYSRTKIAGLGLNSGDTLSFSAKVLRTSGTKQVRPMMVFFNADMSVITQHEGPFIDPTGGRIKLEDIEIPPNTVYMTVAIDNDANAGTVVAERAMLNTGNIAAPYSPPVVVPETNSNVTDTDTSEAEVTGLGPDAPNAFLRIPPWKAGGSSLLIRELF